MLLGAQEDGRLGVRQLVRELGRGEPRVQRHQDQSRLRAGEEDHDVLGARTGQRRHAVTRDEARVQEAGREPVRALVELPVSRPLVAEVDRDRPGVARARSLIQRPKVKPLASAQELLELADEPLGLLPHEQMATALVDRETSIKNLKIVAESLTPITLQTTATATFKSITRVQGSTTPTSESLTPTGTATILRRHTVEQSIDHTIADYYFYICSNIPGDPRCR